MITPFLLLLSTVFSLDNELANGIVSAKYFRFYLSAGFASVVLTFFFVFNQRLARPNIPDLLIIAFCITGISVTYNYNQSLNSKSILLILLTVFYFYFRFVFQANKCTIIWLTVCFIFTGLAEAILGLRQLYGFDYSHHHLFLTTGSFFNPGPYACYIAIVLPIAFFYTLKYRICYKVKFHVRNIFVYFLWGISLLTLIASILILPATMSRASWIAATGGCGLVSMYFLAKKQDIKTFIAIHKRICILIACTAFLLITVAGGFGMYYLKKDSADGRAFIWKNSIELIKQNPVGVGTGNFSGSYGHIQAAYFEAGSASEDEKRVAGNPEYAFNEYLQICAEQGITGFLLFVCIIVYSLYVGFKQKKIAATASLLALLIAAGVSYPFSVLPCLIVFVFLLALINNGKNITALPKAISIAFAFCILMVASLCLSNRYPTYDAYKKWHRMKQLYSHRSYEDTANGYRIIYPLLSDQLDFLFEYAQCLSKSEQYAESNTVLEKAVKISCDPMLYNVMGKNCQALKRYAEAEQCFRKAANIVPGRIYPWYLLANLYVEMGETEKAQETACIVLTKEPKVQSTAVREMREKIKEIIQDSKIQKHTDDEQEN
ncbi:MAG: O-antigen ligase family protein [Tannerella sp.]|nr:O-antigen ligase family protein [Tannerella sp.]